MIEGRRQMVMKTSRCRRSRKLQASKARLYPICQDAPSTRRDVAATRVVVEARRPARARRGPGEVLPTVRGRVPSTASGLLAATGTISPEHSPRGSQRAAMEAALARIIQLVLV